MNWPLPKYNKPQMHDDAHAQHPEDEEQHRQNHREQGRAIRDLDEEARHLHTKQADHTRLLDDAVEN